MADYRYRVKLTAALLLLLCAGLAVGDRRAYAADYDPAADMYSMFNTTKFTGALDWWKAGYTGAGVDVALIDTGVAPVEGLATPGKIIYGPDFSLESQVRSLTNLDANGHGTFMAGLIAGHDSTLSPPFATAPSSAYRGMAPDARIVSVKVGVADGGTDVSQVIAAINWVIQHKNDNGLNIRVINLSFGTNTRQSCTVDPLAYAAEQAWKSGIVVVAAAGNSRYQTNAGAPGLGSPAYDPYVIGVGAYDTMGTDDFTDDQVASYSANSAGCPSCKNPDFVAAGSHLQSLRVPNSYIDVHNPEGRISSRYFRGSGTSEAAAMTSGTIALILQKYPHLTPDQVKHFIAASARKIPGADVTAQGAGEINLKLLATSVPSSFTQSFRNAKGSGSLEASRGTDHLTQNGVVLRGEVDIFGRAFRGGSAPAGSFWSGSTWSGSSWSGSSWSGSSWSGSSWSGSSWSGSSWSGSSWSGSSWSGSSWSGSSWSGGSWATWSWN